MKKEIGFVKILLGDTMNYVVNNKKLTLYVEEPRGKINVKEEEKKIEEMMEKFDLKKMEIKK